MVITDIKKEVAVLAINLIVFTLKLTDCFCEYFLYFNMKYRLDNAILKLNYEKIFNITNDEYKPMKWFDEEIYSNTLDDFFSKRPVDYTKKDKSFNPSDLFGD